MLVKVTVTGERRARHMAKLPYGAIQSSRALAVFHLPYQESPLLKASLHRWARQSIIHPLAPKNVSSLVVHDTKSWIEQAWVS